MLPSDYTYGGWAASGEIDIMEAVNLKDGEAKEIHGTLHYGREWPANAYSGASYEFEESDPTEEFHTYAIEWANGEIRWYVDEVHYATQRQSGWYSQFENEDGEMVTADGAAPFDQRFHLLLNVAVGGAWPGNPDESTEFPVEMEVDFVRVYECPSAKETLVTCATKDRRAQRVFGNEAPEIVEVEFDPTFIEANEVVVFAEEDLAPFALGQYVANGSVDMSVVPEEGRGNVTRLQYNTNESVVYWQAPMGFDFSEFSKISFDVKVVSDPRDAGGLIMKVDCFYPCGTGDVPREMAEVGAWTT
jgi:beta-glucanase (GH16 family)